MKRIFKQGEERIIQCKKCNKYSLTKSNKKKYCSSCYKKGKVVYMGKRNKEINDYYNLLSDKEQLTIINKRTKEILKEHDKIMHDKKHKIKITRKKHKIEYFTK